MKIKATITLHANGTSYPPGSLLDLADDEAARLVSRGFAEGGETEPAADTPAPATQRGQSPSRKPAPTLEDIVDAIAALDPAKDFGKNGKPNVEALEDLLDANVTASQRDEAWERYQKDQSEDGGAA